MTQSEEDAILDGASKRYEPTSLIDLWTTRNDPNPSVEKFVKSARLAVGSPELDDPGKAPAYTARLMQVLLLLFSRLIETGKMDEVLPRLPALPILYSPNTGIGAKEWRYAREIFESKRVGTQCMLPYRGLDTNLGRNPMWLWLATDTLLVILYAVLDLPGLRQKKTSGRFSFARVKRLSKGAKKSVKFEVYQLPNDEILVWPDWLEKCEVVPERDGIGVPVQEAVGQYVNAARAVLDGFFADPANPHSTEIITGVIGARLNIHRSQAIAEVRKNVLKIIRRT